MKNRFFLFFVSLISLPLVFTSCKKNKENSSDTAVYEAVAVKQNDKNDIVYNLNYDFGSSSSEEQKGLSESVIPGVRKLSEYITNYSTERSDNNSTSIKTVRKVETSTEENSKKAKKQSKKTKNKDGKGDADFFIEEWGPQETVVAESDHPSFYVIFSKPVKPLTALDKPSDKSEFMSISPKIEGVFRWYGNQHLSFEASEAADPSAIYTITVPSTVKSLEGDKISGETVFKTKAAPIKIVQLYPCYIGDSEYDYYSKRGALPPENKVFFIRLNYAIPEEKFNQIVEVSSSTTNKIFTLKADPVYSNDYLFSWGSRKTVFSTTQKKTNTFIVNIKEDLPFNDEIVVTATVGDSSSVEKFLTVQKFIISKVNKATDYSGKHKFPLKIEFSQKPDLTTVIGNVEIDGNNKLTAENFSVSGTILQVYDLPFDYNETHTITFKDGIKDIYGQNLLLSKPSYEFKTLAPKSYVKFTNLGKNILEAQFPHKYLFEYQNVNEGSNYRIYQYNKPWEIDYKAGDKTVQPIILDSQTRNKRMFEEIDLNPYLNKDGYGFVRFDTDISYSRYNYYREKEENVREQRVATIQVTDLGVTTRFGLDKCAVLVTSLKTGKPISNAEVYVSPYDEDADETSVISSAYGYAKSNKDGLAVINISEKDQERYIANSKGSYYSSNVMVYVKAGSDSVIYSPQSHRIRGYDVEYRRPYYAAEKSQQTFMFVDRGIYRPGEIVTFRGIDRDLYKGKLSAVEGSYNIEVKENVWRSTEIIANLSGTTSGSGGFYGSFKLPDDVKPGNYLMEYKRSGNSKSVSINFVIAEFERLKFETSVKIPEITYYGGDSVSGTIIANYLAGGSLAGASYNAKWYKQPATFNPQTPETKNYRFTNSNYSDSRDLVSESNGVLGADGNASVRCKTDLISDGRPYNYRLSATITDVSNQQIGTSGSVLVHPAKFYVGVARPLEMAGFAKKGEKLEFPYILVNTEGHQLDTLGSVKSLKYKLIREEWTVAHEQSVYNSIYTRYKKQYITEQEADVKPLAKDTISITPKQSGWYSLELTGIDKENNPTIVSYGFFVTGGKAYAYNNNDGESISLTPNQTMYNPGETAQILLESALPEGDYLITVEREGIYSEEVKHFDSPANVIEVPIDPKYVPVVYVSVSSYSVRTEQPKHEYGEVDMDKPKGFYGVTALHINPKVKSFNVDVKCDKPSYRPGDEVTVTLKATIGGNPFEGAELTLMAVDRGVIDLINYHVPDPISFFYSEYKYPLCVMGGDDREYLMDPVTYSVKDLAGGDADGDEEKENERKDFRPTAVFEPVLITGKDGTVQCKFKMPDSLTTYRITAFGVKDDLFALHESEVKVQNPINVQQIQPRKLRVRDTAECGVLITNLGAETEAVTVSLEVRSPNGNITQDEQEGRITIPGSAIVDGESKHTVNVEAGYSSVVYFDVAALKPGTVELVYKVESNVLNEKLVSAVRIEDTYIFETVTMTSSTDSTQTEQVVIPGSSKNGEGSIKCTLDATRLGPLTSAVNYVFTYPYGCLEQRSSRVLPLVLFEDYLDVFEFESQISDTHRYIKREIKYWSVSQFANGGFPYWPGNYKYTSPYVSARIGHICAIAKKRGYKDNEIAINLSTLGNYLANEAFQKSYTYQQAYIAYVLALMGHPDAKVRVNNVMDKLDDCNNVALAYLGLACLEIGNKSDAEKVAKELRKYIQSSERSVTMLPRDGKYFDVWYTSDVSNLAVALQLFVSLNPDDKIVDRLVDTVLKEKSVSGYWNNTSDTAKVLEAVYTYIKARNLDNLNFTANAKVDNTVINEGNFKGVAAKPVTKTYNFNDTPFDKLPRDSAIPFEFEKNGEGNLYYTVEMRYALPDEIVSGRDEGIGLEYTITDVEADVDLNMNSTVIELVAGRTYRAKVRISSPRDRTYLALRSPIPSGAEIIDSTFVTSAGGESVSQKNGSWRQLLSSKAIYDNEVQFFWDRFGSGGTEITFTFRAGRRGVYPTPAVLAECMYEPEIFGRTDGYLFVIK